jgi:acetyl-CoA carboxylase carboxyl transferase subunit beta
MAVFTKPELNTNAARTRKRDMPEGLFTKCPSCGEMLFNKELDDHLQVCRNCQHHFPLSARARLASLLDTDSFREMDAEMTSVDILQFTGSTNYAERLETYQRQTGLRDAVVSGSGLIEGQPVSMAVMDFAFLGGSMGSVVGEKISRAIERATESRVAAIVVCASGGARMHESMLSLMQMAKTSGAVHRHREARLPFLSVLTNPTMGGVTASFAALGDVLLAEPRAMIGFAGARVIKETTRQDLPKGFQTAEFLLERGLIDLIVARKELRATLGKILSYLAPAAGDAKSEGAGSAPAA